MQLVTADADADADEMDIEKPSPTLTLDFPTRTQSYRFDGAGNYRTTHFDLSHQPNSPQFDWYHIELPKANQKLSVSAQTLISILCPPLTLQDILTLASNGPFCGIVNNALIFRVNSSGPAISDFSLRIAARVTENSVVTVSLGRVPGLGFVKGRETSLLSEVPSVDIGESLLESLLAVDHHSEEADRSVPKRVADLLVYVIETHVDQVQDRVTRMEVELDSVELELDRAGSMLKKQMLDDRRFPKMHLNLQRLLQVVAHGEQVFPRVKEKCASKSWFANEDIVTFEELIGRLRRLKENLGFIVNRVTAVQAGLNSWQSEQINKKLYYLSFLSMIFLPLSIVTGIFGMNVGGLPWTGKNDPSLKDGFLNVMLICAAMLFLFLLGFSFPSIYSRVSSWKRQWAFSRSFSFNRKSFKRFQRNGDYYRV